MSGAAERPETFSEYRDVPSGACLRCGEVLPDRDYLTLNDGGRPRRWCSPACRRAASRLRKSRGDDWWRGQPWYPAWHAARADWLEKRKKHDEWQRVMPPHVRRGYDKARREDEKTAAYLALDLDNFRLGWERKHRRRLASFGAEIRLVTRREHVVERLLAVAVRTSNEHEAQAMFEKARAIAQGGDIPEEAEQLADTVKHAWSWLFSDLNHLFDPAP